LFLLYFTRGQALLLCPDEQDGAVRLNSLLGAGRWGYLLFSDKLLGSTISSAYKLACDPSPTPSCTYDWLNTYHMLTGGHLGFSFPYNATYTNDSCNNIAYPVRAFTYTVVQYTQDGVIKAPTSGDAVMIFSLLYIGENTSQWHWEGIILQSSC